MTKTIDVEVESPPQGTEQAVPAQQALMRHDRTAMEVAKPQQTPQQARVDAVANLTFKAYEAASKLTLTAEEIRALAEAFPDEAFKKGAAGKENLIYIEHAYLRDRLNQVIGVGQWAIVPRSRWAEEFDYTDKQTRTTEKASRVYVEAMLLIRGAFVAEAIGDMVYYPKNQTTNYGDAVEGAKTAALRRCAKELGVGLQAWKKDFCDGWWRRNPSGYVQHKQPPKEKVESKAPIQSPPKVAAEPEPSRRATDKTKGWMIDQIDAKPELRRVATEFFCKCGAILDTENLEELPLPWVATNKEELGKLFSAFGNFEVGDPAAMPYFHEGMPKQTPVAEKPIEVPRGTSVKDSDDPNSPDAVWRSFPMPWGKQAGTELAELEKNYLFGLWANYEVETEYNGKPKKPETIAKDEEFRRMLDMAGEHYDFEKKG